MTTHSRSKTKSTLAAAFFVLLAMIAPATAQSDATLFDLVPSAGTLAPAFASGTVLYTASVPYGTTDITVTPTATDPNATITVNTVPVISGSESGAISLSVGTNQIATAVTSQDLSMTITYYLTVTRAAPNVDLSSLVPSVGTLTPAFDSGTTDYNASVVSTTTEITVTPTAINPSATITVDGNTVASGSASGTIPLNFGDNTITTVVTGEDFPATTKTYTLIVTRAAPSADLSSLVPSVGTLNPDFDSATTDYTSSVPNATDTITVTPTAAEPVSSITVNGATVASGSPSAPITLTAGAPTDISVVIKSINMATTKTYTLTVARAALFTDGTWNTNADGSWSNSANWTSDAIANGSDFTATFGDIISGNRTITLDADRTIGNITASDTTHNYTISGENILTLDRTSGVPTIDATTAGRTLTISSQIAGNDSLTKTGDGTLVLRRDSTSNTYTGTTTLSAGTLQANTGNSLIASIANPLGTTALQLNGGTLQLRSDNAASGKAATTIAWGNNTTVGGNVTINVGRVGSTGSNKIHQLGTLSIGEHTLTASDVGSENHDLTFGATTLTGNATFNVATGAMNLTPGLVGDGGMGYSLTKSGSGTLSLTNASNSFAGGITISGGVLAVSSDGALGAAANSILFTGTGALSSSVNNVSLAAGRTITVNTGAIAILCDINVNNNPLNYTVGGKITGDGGVQVGHYNLGNGTTYFTNTANDFTGSLTLGTTATRTLNYGTNFVLNIASLADASGYGNIIFGRGNGGTNLANFNWSANAIAPLVLDNRRIQLDTTTEQSAIRNNNGSSTNTITVNTDLLVSRAGNKTLILGGSNTGTNTFAGLISNSVIPAATISLTKADAGLWILSNTANSYTGATTLTGGTLSVGASNNLGAAASNLVFNGGTLRITGTTLTNFSGIGHTVSFTATKAVGLDIDDASHTFTADQVLNQTTGTLTKAGLGTLVLNQANTYSGATTVSAGNLKLGNNDVIPNASNVTIGAATLDADTRTDTAGTLNVTGTAVINLGSSAAALAFAKSSAVTWAGTLNITGTFVPGASLRFGTDNTGLTPAQLAKITVAGVPGYYLDASGYLTAPGPVASFEISAIASPQTVGTPITGITLTAKDASNLTATSFTGTVTFGGTGGFTGTSANFVAGVLTGVSVTPTVAGSDLTLTVDDGAGHTGSAMIATTQPGLGGYDSWAGGALFDADANNDGVDNGIAWVLGAANPSDNAIALLPILDNTNSDFFIFTYQRDDDANTDPNTTIKVEYGSTLSGWTEATPSTDIIITPTNEGAGAGIDLVQVKIRRALAVDGKLFARLNVQNTP